MSYATVQYIEEEFKDVEFTSTSALTDTEVTRFLEEADAEIDMNLGTRYQTPITGTQALIIMRIIAIWLVKSRVSEILRIKTGRIESDQDGGSDPAERAREMLTKISQGKLNLTDATLANSYDGVRSYTSENAIEHVFDTETTQW
jgi:phage gp36-like protein